MNCDNKSVDKTMENYCIDTDTTDTEMISDVTLSRIKAVFVTLKLSYSLRIIVYLEVIIKIFKTANCVLENNIH